MNPWPSKILSPKASADAESSMKFRPMINAGADTSGFPCLAYVRSSPHLETSLNNRSDPGVLWGVNIKGVLQILLTSKVVIGNTPSACQSSVEITCLTALAFACKREPEPPARMMLFWTEFGRILSSKTYWLDLVQILFKY